MMRLAFAILCTCALLVTPASAADWRWAAPDIKKVKPHIFDCKTKVCKKKAKRIARLKTRLKIAKYHYKKSANGFAGLAAISHHALGMGKAVPDPNTRQSVM